MIFVDVNPTLVEALNRERRYRIEIKDRQSQTIWIEGVSAIDGRSVEDVAHRDH